MADIFDSGEVCMSKDKSTNSNDGFFFGIYKWYMKVKLRYKISLLVGCNLLFIAAAAAAGLLATRGLIALSPSAGGEDLFSQLLFRVGALFFVALILGPIFGALVFKSVADPLANVHEGCRCR